MKLKISRPASPGASGPPTPAIPTPSSTGGFKLKIRTSAPPTPVTESAPALATPLGPPPTKPKRPYNKKPKPDGDAPTKPKRPAAADISPAPKRRISLKLGGLGGPDSGGAASPPLATPKLKLAAPSAARRQSAGIKAITLTAKKRPPPRPVGVGYDSEASDAEADPAVEQQFVLRMPDPDGGGWDARAREGIRDDTRYVRLAVEEKRVGLPLGEGGADVAIRFVSRDLRRAVVCVRGNRYAAAMVDLPCVVESMKSWDRKGGWWKAADVAQVLLVLGPVAAGTADASVDEEVKKFPLPREVDKEMRYAHGLTPPMHWVRRRRFRKRVDYKDVENVDDEVNKLLREDKECAARGGEVRYRIYDGAAADMDVTDADAMDAGDDAPQGYLDSTEDAYGTAAATPLDDDDDDEIDEADLLAGLENLEDADAAADADAVDATATTADGGGADTAANSSSAVDTPAADMAAAAAAEEDESSSDEDSGSDEAGSVVDEDALAAANEAAEKRDEIADLTREVANKRAELDRMTNQLLRQRVRQNLKALEDELAMKKKAFGIGGDDDDDDE